MIKARRFGKAELKSVDRAREAAEEMISSFYVLAPREWERVNYEVRTLEELSPEEICDRALAQVLCYDCVKRIGASTVERHDLYRICLQDDRILRASDRIDSGRLALEPLLLYVLTHELVHIVRFSQHLQRLDLAPEFRSQEELSVEQTTRQILAPAADRALQRVIATFANG
ncbi:MAG: hypothetical protein L0226_01750 [Acidobacteria bacterium]|nr:hypothetical protein [Acidobacteriota bacterium]